MKKTLVLFALTAMVSTQAPSASAASLSAGINSFGGPTSITIAPTDTFDVHFLFTVEAGASYDVSVLNFYLADQGLADLGTPRFEIDSRTKWNGGPAPAAPNLLGYPQQVDVTGDVVGEASGGSANQGYKLDAALAFPPTTTTMISGEYGISTVQLSYDGPVPALGETLTYTLVMYGAEFYDGTTPVDLPDQTLSITVTPEPVPEPATLTMFSVGTVALLWRRRRKK